MKLALSLLAAMSTVIASAFAADPAPAAKTETAVIGGGCFWCVEAQYKMLKGVKKVISGYAGGSVEKPTYRQVCTGETGHAEVVQITYDPALVTYKELIDLFWDAHDPTQLNRQGNDHGTQYRSTIMYANEEQKKVAEASMKEAAKTVHGTIVTEIVPLKTFYPAEDYHQDYSANNPNQPYVLGVVDPKVDKFRHKLEEKGKSNEKK